MSLETLASLLTPLMIAVILKLWGNQGYVILAILDVVFAFILIVLTFKLKELSSINKKINTLKKVLVKNYETAKNALNNILTNNKLKLLLIYRSLANHVAFLYIISLPICVENGMEPWMAGVFGTI